MFGIEALEVVIGLIFVYLLFSLFVTIINEMLSQALKIRGKELRFSIERMIGHRLRSLFYDQPKINKTKYRTSLLYGTPLWKPYVKIRQWLSSNIDLDSQDLEKKITNKTYPSNIAPSTFADTMLEIIENEEMREELFEQAPFLRKKYEEANGKIEVLRDELEDWFNEIMTYTSEWYKQKLRIVLLGLGFLTAAAFNVDTFSIVKKLSDDPEARTALVQQAEAFTEKYEYENGDLVLKDEPGDTLAANPSVISRELNQWRNNYYHSISDSQRVAIRDSIQENTNQALSEERLNQEVEDELNQIVKRNMLRNHPRLVTVDSLFGQLAQLRQTQIEMASSTLGLGWNIERHGTLWKAIYHQFRWYSIFGWLVSAFAISLGAPFWFDLLNRVVNIKEKLSEKGK